MVFIPAEFFLLTLWDKLSITCLSGKRTGAWRGWWNTVKISTLEKIFLHIGGFCLMTELCLVVPCRHSHVAYLSLPACLEVLSARPICPDVNGSSTTTWGLSRKHQPLWTPTWSLLSWMTTVLSAPSAPGCFCRSVKKKTRVMTQTNYICVHFWSRFWPPSTLCAFFNVIMLFNLVPCP